MRNRYRTRDRVLGLVSDESQVLLWGHPERFGLRRSCHLIGAEPESVQERHKTCGPGVLVEHPPRRSPRPTVRGRTQPRSLKGPHLLMRSRTLPTVLLMVVGVVLAQVGLAAVSASASAAPLPSLTSVATPTGSPSLTVTAAGASPSATVPATGSAVELKFIHSEWGGGAGRTTTATITNTGTQPVSSWTVKVPYSDGIIDVWNGSGSSRNGTLTVSNAAWNGTIAPGTSTTFGFNDTSAKTPTPPTCDATLNGSTGACSISGAAPSPSPTSTTAPTQT